MTKKLVFGLILLVIMAILVAGCVSCKPACPTCGNIIQKRIIGIVEKTEHQTYFFVGGFKEVCVVSISGEGKLFFIKEGDWSKYILVRNWSEVDCLQSGMRYEWLLEKDVSCSSSDRPWTLVNTTQI
jgi:hypothetical protein